MSQQPPPGWVPPGYPGQGPGPAPGSSVPTYGASGHGTGGYGPPPGPGWVVPVPQPGVVPLRPLRLGDLLDGAFKTIRRNPAAMVGLAAVVTTVFLVVPFLVTLVLAWTGDLSSGLLTDSGSGTGTDLSFLDGGTVLSLLGSVFGALATVVLNGMLVHVVAQAVLGRRTDPGQAWAATRGRLLRLVGLTLLNMVVALLLLGIPVLAAVLAGLGGGVGIGFLVGVPLFLLGLAALAFVQVRFFLLAAPALVLERIGVLASVRRAGRLSHQQFWRLLGVMLLTTLVVGVVSQVVAIPLGLIGVAGPLLVPGTGGALVLVFSSYLSQVVVGAVTTPFASAVVALQYVDQRIRKEGLDVQLIAAAQAPPPEQAQQPGRPDRQPPPGLR